MMTSPIDGEEARKRSGEEARKAIVQAEKALQRQLSLWESIRQRIEDLTALAEENHFADKIVDAFRSKP